MFTMKEIVKVQSMDEAYELNQKRANKVLGGMLWMKMQNNQIGTGIDLSGLGLESITETKDEFQIGCMCTLRTLELHQGLHKHFSGLMKECVRHIVGVQFRNSATVGGSIYSRFGFSDILTCFLALDCYVCLHKKGMISLKEFIHEPYDNDILSHIIIKKDIRIVHYETLRITATDLPILACAVARNEDTWSVSIGARPAKARVETIKRDHIGKEEIAEVASELASRFTFGTNIRGSAAYRFAIAKVLIQRSMSQLLGGSQDAN